MSSSVILIIIQKSIKWKLLFNESFTHNLKNGLEIILLFGTEFIWPVQMYKF